jgi:hypothetical protein
MSFIHQLNKGQIGESLIAAWFKQRGSSVLPVYHLEIDTGKGPQFYAPDGGYVAPDMMVFPSMIWVEAKHKTAFTWHRITGKWCTGIDLRHYQQYQEVERISCRPVWLMFLHCQDNPSASDLAAGCPPKCPSGLFGHSLDALKRCESHRSPNWGRDGMVYWRSDDFKLFATLAELEYLHVYPWKPKVVV